MRYFRVALFVVAACVAGDLLAGGVGYRKGQATALELLALPSFCQWEYDEAYESTKGELRDCGVGTNHYCPAYLDYMRAIRDRNKRTKLQKLSRALKEVEYTLRWLTQLDKRPSCIVLPHATQAHAEIRAALVAAGGHPPHSNFNADALESAPQSSNAPLPPTAGTSPKPGISPSPSTGSGTAHSGQRPTSTDTSPAATDPLHKEGYGLIGN